MHFGWTNYAAHLGSLDIPARRQVGFSAPPIVAHHSKLWKSALLAGGPALDMGDPAFTTPPDHDQRGAPFARVVGGRIDIGALEAQPIPPAVFGDYNQNDVVDAADYVVWRKTDSTNGVPAFSGADGDGDGVIDQDDNDVWRANFSATLPPSGAGSGAAALAFTEPAVEHGDAVVPAAVESTPVSFGPNVNIARLAIFSAFDDRATRRTSASGPQERIDTFRVAKSAGDKLLLLLAVDRVGRSSRQDFSVFADRENEDQAEDDLDSSSLTDEALAIALAKWQLA